MISCATCVATALLAAGAARSEDDVGLRAATQKPQLRSPAVNAARAIGDDEVDFGRFTDQRYASNGAPLASSSANVSALSHSPDGGFYGIIDQQIYRVPGDEPERGAGLFFRAIGAPADRNLADLYLEGGVSTLGIFPERPRDSFGIAVAFARMSPAAADADIDANVARGVAGPVRDFEAVVELTYQAEVIPGLAIQPTFQYIAHPGGNMANPYGNGLQPIHDAKVIGATTIVRF